MKKVIIFVFIITIINPVFSQKYGEVGLFVGSSFFLGDVAFSAKDNMHLSAGVNYRYNFDSRWAWRFDARYAKISGNDINSISSFKQQRNLSFQSEIYELSTVAEFNFFEFKPYKPQSFFQNADVFTPYIFVGLSIFYHNPKTILAGNLYSLREYQTEGVAYSKVSMALPFGVGLKFRLSDRALLGLSMGFRATFTDYLDDVSSRYPEDPSVLSKTTRDLSNRTLEPQGSYGTSWGAQRGDNTNNDWFNYLGATLSFNLHKNPGTCHFNPTK